MTNAFDDAMNAQVAELGRFVIGQARNVAIGRKLKRHSRKGECLSEAAWHAWGRRCLPDRVGAVILEAARATADRQHEQFDATLAVAKYLIGELRKVTRGRGRPRKGAPSPTQSGQGLLKTALTPRPTAQPTVQPFLYGLKLKLYARRQGLPDAVTMCDAVAQLVGPSYRRNGRMLATALDEEVSDRTVAAHPGAAMRFKGTPAAIAKRLQRERMRSPFALPTQTG